MEHEGRESYIRTDVIEIVAYFVQHSSQVELLKDLHLLVSHGNG